MGLKLRNSWRYQGKDQWSWEAFVDDAGSGELKNVEYVEYVLHPTFPNPIRKIDNPENGYLLKTAGWGEFELAAFVHYKDGSKKKLTHEVELRVDPPEGTSK